MPAIQHFWSYDQKDLLQQVQSTVQGITQAEAAARLKKLRKQEKHKQQWKKDLLLLLSQYKSPLVLLLVFAVALSLSLRQYPDSMIVLAVLLSSGILGFIQERNAGRAVEKLRAMVSTKSSVYRSGIEMEIPANDVVQGDIVLLNAGDIIPADGYLMEANDLHVNESVLTGESFPVEKKTGRCEEKTSLADVGNAVFKGTSVINGTAAVLIINAGNDSELGKIARSLESTTPVTAFEKGIKEFGYLLMRITILISGMILILNITFQKPFVDSILFAFALAVGLVPELLPAIMTITLSTGARHMARLKVIVKKLTAIQNLGEMNILCSDKTGTLTEGAITVHAATDIHGNNSQQVLFYAYLNSSFESGFYNPIDEAIRHLPDLDLANFEKIDEVPYDFLRKRLSIVVKHGDRHLMITKGAVENILEVCPYAEDGENSKIPLSEVKEKIQSLFIDYSGQGFRSIGVAYKDVTDDPVITKDDEENMVFMGFILLSDPLKAGIKECIRDFNKEGISLKIISGDHHLVVNYIAGAIGLSADRTMTGGEMTKLSDELLQQQVNDIDVFAEILPDQKVRVIRALQKAGHVVGYLGDGINDANALQTADTGISINNAVDVAREAADIVLLAQDMNVILEGVREGRKTFRNTLKYIYVTTSANFGNMFSMAVAAIALPFLPLLPFQILLNNFLSDLPAVAIASDNVDEELTNKPVRWDFKSIKRFMVIFGLQSSLFDFAVFLLLLFVFHSTPETFRTAWFMESLLTEIAILLVIRTNRPFFKSRPSTYLLTASFIVFVLCFGIPYLPFASILKLYPLPASLMVTILLIVALYVLMSELTKRLLMKFINPVK